MSVTDQRKYPRFTKLVRKLPSFVQNNPKVLNALVDWTGFTAEKVMELLAFGNGPIVKVMDLRSLKGPNIYGHCLCPGVPQTQIEIEVAFVNGLEQANLQSTQEATSFFLTAVLLHEFVHWGLSQIVSYVHTHPYDLNQGFLVNEPTRETRDQPWGDWQLSSMYSIPGKIISPDKIITFHYDSTKTDPRVIDSVQSKKCMPLM